MRTMRGGSRRVGVGQEVTEAWNRPKPVARTGQPRAAGPDGWIRPDPAGSFLHGGIQSLGRVRVVFGDTVQRLGQFSSRAQC